EMTHLPPGADCRSRPLEKIPGSAHRLLVYFGFRDVPPGFESLLFQDLAKVGVVTEYEQFAGLGRTAVVYLGSSDVPSYFAGRANDSSAGPRLEGCVGVAPIRRW